MPRDVGGGLIQRAHAPRVPGYVAGPPGARIRRSASVARPTRMYLPSNAVRRPERTQETARPGAMISAVTQGSGSSGTHANALDTQTTAGQNRSRGRGVGARGPGITCLPPAVASAAAAQGRVAHDGMIATALTMTIGTAIGTLSGYFRGTSDLWLTRLTELPPGIPPLPLILLIIALFGPSPRNTVPVIGAHRARGRPQGPAAPVR